ncbi:MAG: Tim44 domain-containing protein, partial [Marinospirillum sp.]|uniref:Tim44 domain-containing protein n=1 Tax=Marinospirillum sp. TaxID=2183934 RepID=UPI0019DEBC3F
MARFLALSMSCLFVFALGISEADARRMGGGASSGTFSRQASPPPAQTAPRQAAQPQRQQQPAAASRGFGGMLMGLAAGGLLAALFMGGAFEGLQMFDIILMLLIGGGLIMFLRSRATRQVPAEVAASGYQRQNANYESVSTSEPVAEVADTDSTPDGIRFGAPDWFDEEGFLQRARTHFLELQAAWDANDLSGIQEYVTPQLYKFLCEERSRQPAVVKTEVRKLAAEVTNIQQIDQSVELAVMFHGVISESGSQ